MNPVGEVFTTPYIGLTSFAIVLAGWFALKKMPFKIPAGAFAIIVGTLLAWATGHMSPAAVGESVSDLGLVFPGVYVRFLGAGFAQIAPFLAAAIPLAIYDFLESLDNLESAAAEGEHYNVTSAMLVPAGLTILGSLLGSPFPTIIYIGHPGWKSTGARIGYSWTTGVAVLVLSFTGLLGLIMSIIPLVALLPILVYIGMVITAQAFAVTDKRHMPAVALSFIPLIAGFTVLKIKSALGAVGAVVDYEALAMNGVPLLGWERLAGGDILVGMLLGTIGIFVIDRKFLIAAMYAGITAVLSFFGFVHATAITWGAAPEVALGYLLVGAVFVFMHFYRSEDNVLPAGE
jgi:AGZA family xanthine/uracil permease-like MFS transporter